MPGSRRNKRNAIRIDPEGSMLNHSAVPPLPTKAIRFCGDPGIAPSLLVLQTSNAGQFQTFQELQGGAAAGGDVGDLVGEAQLLAGSCGVAAADDGHGLGISQGLDPIIELVTAE